MALHQILLGDQGAAARWLPFALGQLYACPDSAKVSISPAPGVEITLTRMKGQDTVQIRAGGNPDFVILDNVNPTTAYTIPKQFIPNYPNLQTTGPTNAYSHRLYHLGGSRLLSSSGQGLQNDMTKPYIENIDVWGWEGTWFYPMNRFQIESAPASSVFTVRDPTVVADCAYKPTPTAAPVKRLIAIQSEDSHLTPIDPGHIHFSDDLGATWTTNPYPIASVPGAAWFSYQLTRVDVDTLMYSVYLFDRAAGVDVPGIYFVVGRNGGTVWTQAPSFAPEPPLRINMATFYPGNSEGIVLGLATIAGLPDLPPTAILRTLRSTDSCATFTHTDITLVLPPAGTHVIDQPTILRIHPDPDDKDTYAALWVLSTPFNQDWVLGHVFVSLAYTKDNGLSWQYSPITEIWTETGDGVHSFAVDSYGFYQGAFYFYAGNNGPSLRRLYFTKDLGQTWEYTRCSNTTGRGVSQSVQLFKNGLAYPHRSDML